MEPKEILFSQRLKSEAEEKLDPLTLALEEIRRERGEKPVKPRTTDAKRVDRATTSENRPMTESGNADFLHDSHILSRNDVSKKPDEGKKKSREEAWYRKVPFWFWALTVTGYVLATFLAGILFALLLNLK